MKYRKVMSRRTLLRGAGTVAIGLPFLDAMRATSSFAKLPEPPPRAFNLFFGLGFPTPLQAGDPYEDALAPLAPLREKLAIVRGIDQYRANIGSNAHFDGAAAAFTGAKPPSEAQAGGASLDQAIRRGLYPDGQPAGVIPTVLAGTYFRRSRATRYVHSWNPDGTPADLPEETPRGLFERIFGADPAMDPGDDPAVARASRLRKSVLDSVVDQYKYLQSDASNLGKDSRAKIARHLEKIREHEMRVFSSPGTGAGCVTPSRPPASDIPHGGSADPSGEGIDITVEELTSEWGLIADLYATAVQCDRVRFGSLTYQAAGERIRLKGRYEHAGALVYEFDDPGEHGSGGAKGCSHEWWHKFRENRDNTQLRAHVHLMMSGLARFLTQLDDPEYADENGQTILDNALITISTESGDGRHSDAQRELSGVFHAITAANERFKTGGFIEGNAEGVDLYNTMLEAMGVTERLDPDRPNQRVDAILR